MLEAANISDEHIYIKSDGSLDDGMEIVSHPMTLDFHKQFCWKEIMRKAISLGYRSHQTGTCGLHIHVNRDSLGEDHDDQEIYENSPKAILDKAKKGNNGRYAAVNLMNYSGR